MKTIIRFLSSLVTVAALSLPLACANDDVDSRRYPTMDEEVRSLVDEEQATDVALIALDGFNTGDYDAWATQWDQSLRDGIPEKAWLDFRGQLIDRYGYFEELVEVRTTKADTEGFVRFSFLVEHEHGQLILGHVYPEDGDEIVGVFMNEPAGDEG